MFLARTKALPINCPSDCFIPTQIIYFNQDSTVRKLLKDLKLFQTVSRGNWSECCSKSWLLKYIQRLERQLAPELAWISLFRWSSDPCGHMSTLDYVLNSFNSFWWRTKPGHIGHVTISQNWLYRTRVTWLDSVDNKFSLGQTWYDALYFTAKDNTFYFLGGERCVLVSRGEFVDCVLRSVSLERACS